MNDSPVVNKQPSISVVVPVYGCDSCIHKLCERLHDSVSKLTDRHEIVLVDDRSPDGSWTAILEAQKTFPSVKGIQLSRNFGQHVAITVGLQNARGDFVVIMDCDLQDPPEKIPEMFDKLQEGYDCILARRVERSHSRLRVYAGKIYFRLMSKLTKEKIDGSYGSFSLLSRKVVDAFSQFSERDRHYLFIVRWLGFKIGSIDYDHQERAFGKSSYSVSKLLQHALDGLFFQTTVFLQWIVLLGMLFAFSGLGLAAYLIFQYFSHGAAEGWTSIVTLMLVCTGFILTSLGIVGLYVGKIFNQVKRRPLYLIDSVSESSSTW